MLNQRGKFRHVIASGLLLLLTEVALARPQAGTNASQPAPAAQNQPAQNQKDQDIPDAPSAVQPAKPVPENPPAPEPEQSQPQQQPPPESQAEPAPRSEQETPAPQGEAGTNPAQPPPVNLRTVPEGAATKEQGDTQEQLFTIQKNVNQVMIPVLVKDEAGHMVNGLQSKDFTVLENGKKQTLNFFTADPFALSVAVIVDLGMKDVDVEKVRHSFSALQGAFSQFDEVSIYTYSNTVGQLSGWTAVGQQLDAALDRVNEARGTNNGPPVTSGPFGPNGPSINGMPANPGAPTVYAPVQEAHVMNDAILKAAMDLSRRDRTRRKVIFIISDGREYRSEASYHDVLQVLLKNNIMVYAVGLGGSSIPGYNKLAKVHIPRLGYTDLLPKYVNATTGTPVVTELTRAGIEDAYAQILGDARNQYTMGYLTHAPPSGAYRSFEILVNRPSCKSSIRPCVNVYAPDGYYPAPPAR